jgi:nitroreductase
MQIHTHASFLKDASAAIIVCGDTNQQLDENFWVVDTSAATQNLLLAIHGKGLGGCWCAIYPYEERMKQFQELLGLPDNIKPNALVVVGYPKKIPPQPTDRFKKEKIHYNKW